MITKLNEATVKHRLSLLKIISKEYKKPNNTSIIGFLRGYKVPGDYSKLLIKEGYLKRVEGCERGPGKYQWIGGPPTLELTRKIMREYNKLRVKSMGITSDVKKTQLSEINRKLDLIIKMLSAKTD